ncbi:MAG: XRE family transcriptional regulator [Nitrospira sp.]|nr:XRE family transcriptional regulator [Nitrospira sp.]
MKKERVEVIRGSDNPFRDADLPNPELENARATLAAEIIGILNERNLSKRKAASITGIDPANITRIRNADLKGFSMDRMIKILASLNHRVEVRVHPIRTRRSKPANVLHA